MADTLSNQFPTPKITTHPALRLIDYTIANLEGFMDIDVTDPGPLMAQWLNSLAGILTMSFQALLAPEKVSTIALIDETFVKLGFPDLRFMAHRSEHPCDFDNLERLLRFLRNGFAHGHTEFVAGHWHQGLRGNITVITVGTNFAGVAVWNEWTDRKRIKHISPPIVLDFADIHCFVQGLANLCHDRGYWNEGALNWSGAEALERYGQLPARMDIVITADSTGTVRVQDPTQRDPNDSLQ